MVTESISGMMDPCTKACGLKTKLTVEVSTSGLMAESTTVNGKTTTCTEKVFIHGRTAECIKDSTRTIASMDLELTLVMMENNMLVGGSMESNTVKELIARMAVTVRESGKMAKE